MSIEAMKQALEAAEVLEKLFRQAEAMHKGSLPSMNLDCQITTEDLRKGLYAAATLRTAIEKAEKQEPVATYTCDVCGVSMRMESAAAQQEPYGYVSIGDLPVFRKETPEIGRWETVYTTPPAAPVQEPVAWFTEDHREDKSATTYSKKMAERWKEKGWPVTPLYTTPPAAQRQPLTDAEVLPLWAVDVSRPVLGKNKVLAFARAIEAAHGIGEKT